MKIEFDSIRYTVTVDGVAISLDLLANLAYPDPNKFYRLERKGDQVTLTGYTVEKLKEQIGKD